jgi:serine protease Do
LGLSLGSIPTSDPNYGKLRGVHVDAVAPGSAADEAGLEAGDIIVTANRQPVTTAAALTQIIRDRRGTPILLQVRRGSSALYVALG